MKTKYFKTKKIRIWKFIDALGILVPFCIFLIFFSNILLEDININKNVGFIVFCIVCSAVLSIPYYLIYRSISKTIKRNQIKKTTFTSIQDIHYFRDRLEMLSPTDISMLIDLQIEIPKDIVALILKYQLLGIIDIDNNVITVKDYGDKKLALSDRILLEKLKKYPTLSSQLLGELDDWKKQVMSEVKEKKWFKNSDAYTLKQTQHGCFNGCFSGCLIPFLLIILVVLISSFYPPMKTMYEFLEKYDILSNGEFFNIISKDANIQNAFYATTPIFSTVIICMYWPISVFIKLIINCFSVPKLKRTEAGDQVASYIYGLKNFIHDFSNLSEKDKDYLVLWEDFLIYAVLLEENEMVIDELLSRKNFDCSFIKMFK